MEISCNLLTVMTAQYCRYISVGDLHTSEMAIVQFVTGSITAFCYHPWNTSQHSINTTAVEGTHARITGLAAVHLVTEKPLLSL